MNISSWKLFKMVEEEIDYMILIMNMELNQHFFELSPERKTSSLNFAIDNDEEITKFYRDNIKDEEESMFNIVDMNPLDKETLR